MFTVDTHRDTHADTPTHSASCSTESPKTTPVHAARCSQLLRCALVSKLCCFCGCCDVGLRLLTCDLWAQMIALKQRCAVSANGKVQQPAAARVTVEVRCQVVRDTAVDRPLVLGPLLVLPGITTCSRGARIATCHAAHAVLTWQKG